jgi:hypothetical protein
MQTQQTPPQKRDFEQFDTRDIDEMYDLASRDFKELDARAVPMGSGVEQGAGGLMGHLPHHHHHGNHRHHIAQSGSSMMDQMQQSQQTQMDPSQQPPIQRREDEFWTRRFVYRVHSFLGLD